MKEKINNLNIPNDLKTFLLQDINYIKPILNDDLLLDIEYLYLYYSVFYNVSDQQYSTSVIVFIKEHKKVSSLKQLLRTAFSEQEPSNIQKLYKIRHQQERNRKLFEEIKVNFIELAEDVHDTEIINSTKNTYKLIGKMELISDLEEGNYYSKVFNLGLELIEKHSKSVLIN